MTTSPRFPQAADAQSARPFLINVREAAKQLQISTSTVYRLDRVNGPLRFISAKRPITIDQGSVEASLAKTKGIGSEPGVQADNAPCLLPASAEVEHVAFDACVIPVAESRVGESGQPMSQGQTHPQIAKPMIQTFEIAKAKASLPASGSCGQRELIMRPRSGPCIVTYQSFLD